MSQAMYPHAHRKAMLILLMDKTVSIDFETLARDVADLEQEAEFVYQHSKDRRNDGASAFSLDDEQVGADRFFRNKRIDRAFVAADPDYFGSNAAKRLSKRHRKKPKGPQECGNHCV